MSEQIEGQMVQRFIALVTFDQQGVGLVTTQARLEREIQVLESQEKELATEEQRVRDRAHDLKKKADSCELEMKTLDVQAKRVQEKLDTLTDMKEYGPLKKELAHLKERQYQFEETLVAAWNDVEQAERERAQQMTIIEQKRADIRASIVKKKDELAQIQKEREAVGLDRASRLSGIPEEWLSKYEMMRTRISNPVVPVVHDSCSACFYVLNPQDFIALRRKQIMPCKECFRLLYEPRKASE